MKHTDPGGDTVVMSTWRQSTGGRIYMGEGDKTDTKKEARIQTNSENTKKTQIKQKEELKCFPGRVKRKWTNKEESAWKEGNTPSSLSALSNPSELVGGCSLLLGSAQSSRHTSHTTAHNLHCVARFMLIQGTGTLPSQCTQKCVHIETMTHTVDTVHAVK